MVVWREVMNGMEVLQGGDRRVLVSGDGMGRDGGTARRLPELEAAHVTFHPLATGHWRDHVTPPPGHLPRLGQCQPSRRRDSDLGNPTPHQHRSCIVTAAAAAAGAGSDSQDPELQLHSIVQSSTPVSDELVRPAAAAEVGRHVCSAPCHVATPHLTHSTMFSVTLMTLPLT